MSITLEELENQPFVQAHRDLYRVALHRESYSQLNSDKAFWDSIDPDVRDRVKEQMRKHGEKAVWRML